MAESTISTKSISRFFVPIYALRDEKRPKDKKFTQVIIEECYQRRVNEKKDPNFFEKRSPVEYIGTALGISGLIAAIVGFFRGNTLGKLIGGIFTLGGIGALITGVVKEVDIEIDKFLNKEDKKIEEIEKFTEKIKEKIKAAESKKRAPRSGKPRENREPLYKDLEATGCDPEYIHNLKRLFETGDDLLEEVERSLEVDAGLDVELDKLWDEFYTQHFNFFIDDPFFRDVFGLFFKSTSKTNPRAKIKFAHTFNDFFTGRTSYKWTGTKSKEKEAENKREYYCKILGVSINATQDEIKKAYKDKAKIYHPDKNLGREEEVIDKFKKVCEAYHYLQNN